MEKYEVFVCYRKDESEALVCLIIEKLKQRGFSVLSDVELLRSGMSNADILKVLEESNDVLVVIPNNGIVDCNNNDDRMCVEIAKAISVKKNIISILMRNYSFPDSFPDEITGLGDCCCITADMERIDIVIEKMVSLLHTRKRIENKFLKELNISNEHYAEASNIIESIRKFNRSEDIFRLAEFYVSLRKKDLNEEIVRLYKKASERGYAPAQNGLGNCYYKGVGVEANIEKAFYWYCQAAFQYDNSESLYSLYRCLEKKSQTLAFVYLQKAFDSNPNDVNLVKEIAQHYEDGVGIACDYEKAKVLYKKAYDMGEVSVLKKTKKSYWAKIKIKRLFSD